MSPSSQWTLFIARPGRDRQHVIRDPRGEPRIIFGKDDGTRINDRLAKYLVESLNAGVDVEDRIRMRAGSWTARETATRRIRPFSSATLISKSGSRSSTRAALKRIRRWAEGPERKFAAKRFVLRLSSGKTANRI
jgi:hypothetical protein